VAEIVSFTVEVRLLVAKQIRVSGWLRMGWETNWCLWRGIRLLRKVGCSAAVREPREQKIECFLQKQVVKHLAISKLHRGALVVGPFSAVNWRDKSEKDRKMATA